MIGIEGKHTCWYEDSNPYAIQNASYEENEKYKSVIA